MRGKAQAGQVYTEAGEILEFEAEHLEVPTRIQGDAIVRKNQLSALKLIQTAKRNDRDLGQAKQSSGGKATRPLGRTPSLLKGLIFGPAGASMTPAHTRKNGRLYRYYIVNEMLRTGTTASPIRRIPANQIEDAVVTQIKKLVQSPEIVVATWRAARKTTPGLTERKVRDALFQFDELWDELFPAEQARIVQLLVERVDISESGADLTLRTGGLSTLLQSLRPAREAA